MKKFSNNSIGEDQKQIFIDYYRSIFNATVISPFQLSSSSSDDDDDENNDEDYPQISSISIKTDDDDDDCDSNKPLHQNNEIQPNRSTKNAIPGMAKLIQIINDD